MEAGRQQALLARLRELPWEDYLPAGKTFVVDFTGTDQEIRNTRYGAQLTKDAIIDRFSGRGAARPVVDRRRPDLRFDCRLRKGRLQVSVDLVGGSLHQRGYRAEAGAAPLKENLAAALLLRADWPGVAARGGALIDPMCGSATLLLEGAMMAADIAPGLSRERWSFTSFPWHNERQWQAILADARGRSDRGRARELPEIRGYDVDRKVIARAGANIERAGLERQVRVSCKPLAALKQPTHKRLLPGLVICNPPYGERLGERDTLPALYGEIGEVLLREFQGWQAAIFTGEKALGKAVGIRSHRQYPLYNGAIPGLLLLFELEPENRMQPRIDAAPAPEAPGESAGMFANRLAKNQQKVQRWARRQGVSCYRLYDADMPEYNVAIDRYNDCLHVAEYRAPASVDAASAQRRLDEVMQALPGVTGVAPERIYLKQRQRQRGREQYQRLPGDGRYREVQEGAVKLLVNLGDYLDTGLFLDHRPLRLRLAQEAKERDFLNLFCYTASASVHAAMGGARSTTSVDLSNTYLQWGRRNFEANGLSTGRHHKLERADCLAWLADTGEQFDLVLADPPSFSNSKRLDEDFDVQRDHVRLVEAIMQRLRPGGTLYFSNNLRSFRLDEGLAGRFAVEDITASTVDFDFRRTPKIHRCWRIQHA